jgi:hypothetical protein
VTHFHGRRLLGRTLAIALVSLITASPAWAYLGDSYDPTSGTKHFSASSITYGWDPQNPPPTWLKTQITAQLNYMNDPANMAANIPTTSGPVTSPTIMYKYGGTSPCIEFACAYGPGTTGNKDNPAGWTIYILTDASDGGLSWRKYCQYNNTTVANYRAGCYDVRNIVLHETGHALALGHWPDNAGTIMDNLGPGASITVMQIESRSNRDATNDLDSHGRNNAGWDRHDYGACDMARLQLLYDLNAASSKLSSCLTRQKTTLALARSATSIAYRGAITFTATLSITDDGSGANYAIFAGQKLSGRVVVLERSTDNFATTAATYTMPASGTGTYALTFNLTYTSQWRAYFATPTEGLAGVRSPAYTVTVAPCTVAPCPS